MAYALWKAGERITAARLNEMMGDWADYTPTWTADSGTTTLGNGTLDGRWKRHGNTVEFAIRLQWGTTTTTSVSTANWEFALPTAPSSVKGTTWQPVSAWIYDSSAPARWSARAYVNSTSGNVTAIIVNADGDLMDRSEMPSLTAQGGSTTSVNPGNVAWADGDRLNIWGSYEAA